MIGIITRLQLKFGFLPMNDDINYKTNPLHGLSLKNLLIEIVDHYGFELLNAYLNLNCFKVNASIDSSLKFLKKTDWAREKVESFYLYQFKSLPRASNEQFELSPRDRVIPDGQIPGEPAELSIEDAQRLNEKRARKAASRGQNNSSRSDDYSPRKNNSGNGDSSASTDDDPWANWR